METVSRASASSGKWALGSTLSAVLSSFLASICCIGPLVFALLGIGGAGLLLKLEPYRPYLMVVTAGLLGAGFYFTYRSPMGAQGDECGCEHPKSNRLGRVALWVSTFLVVGFLGFPYLVPFLFD